MAPVEFRFEIKPTFGNLENIDLFIAWNFGVIGAEIQVRIVKQILSSTFTFLPSNEFLSGLWALSLFIQDFWNSTFLICILCRSSLGIIDANHCICYWDRRKHVWHTGWVEGEDIGSLESNIKRIQHPLLNE